MKLIPLFLMVVMLAVGGCSKEDKKPRLPKSIAREESSPIWYFGKSYSTEILKRAEAGDADAQYNLGSCYENGNGVTVDYKEALKWYRKCAEQDNANAQCTIGFFYERGKGVTQDYKEALKWYRKSATQGNAVAQRCIGDCYFEGKGVPLDGDEAVKWYKKSKVAEQRDEEAKEQLELLKSK